MSNIQVIVVVVRELNMGVNRSNGKSIEGRPLRDYLLQAIVPGDLQGSVFKCSKPGLRAIGRTETADDGGDACCLVMPAVLLALCNFTLSADDY